MARSPKCLVIDTDVARSAGGVETQDVRAKGCRDFLLTISNTKHKVVTTEAIRDEWHKHQSRFTRAWLASMVAHKRVCWIDAPVDDEFRHKVELAATSKKKRTAMLKDIHLIEAALQADKIVVSMDETVRLYFHNATQMIGILKDIAWVNPCKDEDTPIAWLREGAQLKQERLLGYNASH